MLVDSQVDDGGTRYRLDCVLMYINTCECRDVIVFCCRLRVITDARKGRLTVMLDSHWRTEVRIYYCKVEQRMSMYPLFSYTCTYCLLVGNLDKASMHMATFHQLARKHKWHTESGDSLHEIACEHLRRIYTSFAEQV